MIVVSDTSPITNLYQIGRLDLLHELFGNIIIPPAVDKEIQRLSEFSIDISGYLDADWIEIISPKSADKVRQLMANLDPGESEAIAIALEQGADYLLIDERLGTNAALSEGLQTIGLIGVLQRAKAKGAISKIRPIIEELENTAGFWIGAKLKARVLADAGE